MRIALATSLVGLFALLGCSATARDRLKHFFFEIPEEQPSGSANDPASANESEHHVVPAGSRPALDLPPARFVSVHEPFRNRDCQACHNAGERMTVDDDAETTCGACHERYFSDNVGHGPVTGGECLLCHDAHRSQFPSLLRSALTETCQECHDAPAELSQPVHAGADAANCSRCHDPHFGEPPLLKPGVVRPSED